MRILVASNKAAAIQKPVTQNALKNMQFDFQPDCLKLIDMLETQEFSMYDQLVLVMSSLDQWDPIQRKTIMNRYLAWAKSQPTSKEIFFIDSSQEFYMDIVTEIQGRANIKYVGEQIRVTDLPKICAGTYRATSTTPPQLSKDTSKRKSVQNVEVPKPRKAGFSLFGKGKKTKESKAKQPVPEQEVQQPVTPQQPPVQEAPQPAPAQQPVQMPQAQPQADPFQEPQAPTSVEMPSGDDPFDVPLFTGMESKQPEVQHDDFGLDLDIDTQPAQSTAPVQQDRFNLDSVEDVPVFQQEPEPQPEPEPEPVYTPQPEPQPAQQPAPEPQRPPVNQAPQQNYAPPMGQPQQNYAPPVQQPQQVPMKKPAFAPAQPAARAPRRGAQTAAFKRSIAVLVTGDRRSGVSGVCSNLAVAASRAGESVLVLDFDFLRRGQSINFPIQHDENDARYLTPLANALRMPHSLDQYAVNYMDGLDYLGTSLVVSDIETAQSTVDNAKIQRLLGTALSKYDMVFIDCPFDKIMEWDALVTGATRIIHVMNNDMNSIMNNINLLCEDAFLDPSIYQMYIPRMGIVLNAVKPINVMGIPSNAQNLLQLFMSITGDEDSYTDFAVLGEIPFLFDYEQIIASDTQIAETKYGQYYQQILQLLREV